MAGVGPYMNRADFRALDDRLRAAHFRLLAAHGHVLIPPPPPVPQPVPMRAPVPEPAPVEREQSGASTFQHQGRRPSKL